MDFSCADALLRDSPLALTLPIARAAHTADCMRASIAFGGSLSVRELLWAASVFASRAMCVPYASLESFPFDLRGAGASVSPAMVPLADLANHRPGALCMWRRRRLAPNASSTSSSVSCEDPAGATGSTRCPAPPAAVQSRRSVVDLVLGGTAQAGTEICISYGAKSNAELAIFYGFTLRENACDRVPVSLTRVAPATSGPCTAMRAAADDGVGMAALPPRSHSSDVFTCCADCAGTLAPCPTCAGWQLEMASDAALLWPALLRSVAAAPPSGSPEGPASARHTATAGSSSAALGNRACTCSCVRCVRPGAIGAVLRRGVLCFELLEAVLPAKPAACAAEAVGAVGRVDSEGSSGKRSYLDDLRSAVDFECAAALRRGGKGSRDAPQLPLSAHEQRGEDPDLAALRRAHGAARCLCALRWYSQQVRALLARMPARASDASCMEPSESYIPRSASEPAPALAVHGGATPRASLAAPAGAPNVEAHPKPKRQRASDSDADRYCGSSVHACSCACESSATSAGQGPPRTHSNDGAVAPTNSEWSFESGDIVEDHVIAGALTQPPPCCAAVGGSGCHSCTAAVRLAASYADSVRALLLEHALAAEDAADAFRPAEK